MITAHQQTLAALCFCVSTFCTILLVNIHVVGQLSTIESRESVAHIAEVRRGTQAGCFVNSTGQKCMTKGMKVGLSFKPNLDPFDAGSCILLVLVDAASRWWWFWWMLHPSVGGGGGCYWILQQLPAELSAQQVSSFSYSSARRILQSFFVQK